MLHKQISRETVDGLAEEAKSAFSIELLDTGWELYRRGFVFNVDVTDNHCIRADVQDRAELCKVQLDLDFLSMSTCSCGGSADDSGGYCRHMSAAFFYVYGAYGRPERYIQQIKEAEMLAKHRKRKEQLKEREQPVMRAVMKNAEPLQSSPEDSLETRTAFFEAEYARFALSWPFNPFKLGEQVTALRHYLLRIPTHWPMEAVRLYHIHVLLYLLDELDSWAPHGSYQYFAGSGARAAAPQLAEELLQTLTRADTAAIRNQYPVLVQQTIQAVNRMEAEKTHAAWADWRTIQQGLWWFLFRQDDWIAVEKERIQGLLQDPDAEPSLRDMLESRLLLFDVMAGLDEQALSRAAQDELRMRDIPFYLNQMQREEDWDRMRLWLQRLKPQGNGALRDFFRLFAPYWLTLIGKRPEAEEEWVRFMTGLLPYSFYYYGDYLIKQERFHSWADLMMMHGVSPAEADREALRMMEKHAPEALLPMYHQSIEKLIADKNRNAYKVAVRLLKKLASLYKKRKKPERFEGFLHRITAKFSRLRAFQEELKKGKLVE